MKVLASIFTLALIVSTTVSCTRHSSCPAYTDANDTLKQTETGTITAEVRSESNNF